MTSGGDLPLWPWTLAFAFLVFLTMAVHGANPMPVWLARALMGMFVAAEYLTIAMDLEFLPRRRRA